MSYIVGSPTKRPELYFGTQCRVQSCYEASGQYRQFAGEGRVGDVFHCQCSRCGTPHRIEITSDGLNVRIEVLEDDR